jgi:tight adherence protein C
MAELHTFALPLSSILLGCACGVGATVISRIVTRKRGSFTTFEESRRAELRASNSTYRWFEPLIDELTRFFPDSYQTDQLAHHLKLGSDHPPWTPAEFMAGRTVEGVMIAACISLFVLLIGSPVLAIVMGLGTGLMYPMLARSSVVTHAKKRLRKLKLRLPFAIDQISLMMEAGAGFEDSLRTVIEDNTRHPLSTEFAEVVRQMSLGRPRSQALAGFRDRMSDDDISEVVFAIVKGEELGTPLSSILREQATQMRLKRSQWGEKAASEAEVQMVFPGMITMIACLLVIVAPILLPVIVELLAA